MDYNQIYDILTLYERYKGSLNDDGTELNLGEITERIHASLPNTKVYILKGSFDMFENRYERVYGAYYNKEDALKKAHEIAKYHHIVESELPMSFDEFSKCNYGYRNEDDIPDNFDQWTKEQQSKWQNEVINRDGHTKEDFNQMQEAFDIRFKNFNFCIINSYIIDTYIDNEETTDEIIYVYPDGRERIIENYSI